LSIARAVARAHHGHFQLENNEGKGCSVTLMLPALR
jgi:signal transduction histidine kinase